MVRKTPIVNSMIKDWNEQCALLAKNEEGVTTRVMVYTIIGHYLATGERLFDETYVRCSDFSNGLRVYVGCFDSNGLCISRDPDYWRSPILGLASARRF